jgi:hypothetical protein
VRGVRAFGFLEVQTKGFKKGRGATWGLLEMTMRDRDGLALIFVEVPPEHPRRRG